MKSFAFGAFAAIVLGGLAAAGMRIASQPTVVQSEALNSVHLSEQ